MSQVIEITFLITSDFSIHVIQLTSKVHTSITFLFVNKTSSVTFDVWCVNTLGLLQSIFKIPGAFMISLTDQNQTFHLALNTD